MGVDYVPFCATLCTRSDLLVIHSLGYPWVSASVQKKVVLAAFSVVIHQTIKVTRHLQNHAKRWPPYTFPSISPMRDYLSNSKDIEVNEQGGSIFCPILQHKCLTLNIS